MPPAPGVRFLYLYCNDLTAMRHFYSELLGLNEIYYAAEPEPAVAYDCDGLQFTIFFDAAVQPQAAEWSRQPGWSGGTQPHLSWSIVLQADQFAAAVDRLKNAGVAAFYQAPQWHNYWSFPVQDPMGYTVEIVAASDPAEQVDHGG